MSIINININNNNHNNNRKIREIRDARCMQHHGDCARLLLQC